MAPSLTRHARHEQRVVGRRARVVAAGEPPRVLVPVVAVRGEAAAAVAVGHVRLGSRGTRLEDRVGNVLRERVEVGLDQLDSGLVVELRVRVRGGMGVGHRDEQLLLGEARSLPDRGAEPELVGRVLEPADVERDERELRAVTVVRREDGGGRRQRAVNALGDLVGRRAPGAGVDPDRRRHVAPGDAERAVRGRECLLGHASTSRVDCLSLRAARPA